MMRLPAIAATCFLAASLAASAARADQLIVVSDSAAIGFARGSVLEDGARIHIPAGQQVALIDASGRGVTLRGPYDAPVHLAGTAQPASPDILAAMKAILASGASLAVGAARNAGDAPRPSDPRLIDISDDATACADPNGTVELWRPAPTRRATVIVTRLSTGTRAELDWAANQPTAAWPAAVPIVDGETYQFALAGALTRPRLEVRLVPLGELSIASAKRLADAGCRNQALVMLEAIAATDTR